MTDATPITDGKSLTDRLRNEALGLKYNAAHLRSTGQAARAMQLDNAYRAMLEAAQRLERAP